MVVQRSMSIFLVTVTGAIMRLLLLRNGDSGVDSDAIRRILKLICSFLEILTLTILSIRMMCSTNSNKRCHFRWKTVSFTGCCKKLQYDREFGAKRLGNWTVAKWYPPRRPRDPFQFTPTKFIVDSQGHFLDSAQKADRNPWNNHIGTYDLPPRITRAIAADICSRPPAHLEYWDKPNTVFRPVAPVAQRFEGGPSSALVAEGPGYPRHRNYILRGKDYIKHDKRILEEDEVVKNFIAERKQQEVDKWERIERVKELTENLRKQQERQRREEADRDVKWLIRHRRQHNIVTENTDLDSNKEKNCAEDEGIGELHPPDECGEQAGSSIERKQDQSHDDSQSRDSGVDSVHDDPDQPGSGGDDAPPPKDYLTTPPFPQYEENSGELLKASNPAYPKIDPSFSRRAAQDPTIQSYPEPTLIAKPGYPEMFTTETDLAAPREEKPVTPPPRPTPERPRTRTSSRVLPDPEAAAQKCGRYPRRPLPARPYARAQFAVVAPEPESPPPSPQNAEPGVSALAEACSGFQLAKQLHKENLEHNPLPDTVNDDMFRKLNSQGHPNPGIALNVNPDAAAVGWRTCNAPGPTDCSKMRIYRPKTAGPTVHSKEKNGAKLQRPSTGYPKMLAKKHVSEMELAICWDLVPAFPEDEPKPSPHIDGSNGSAAPGIFSLVHHDPEESDNKKAGGSQQSGGSRRSSSHGVPKAGGCNGNLNGGPIGTSTPPLGCSPPPKPPSVDSVHSVKEAGRTAWAENGTTANGNGYTQSRVLHDQLDALDRQRHAATQRSLKPTHVNGQQPRDLCDFRRKDGCLGGPTLGRGDGTAQGDPRNLNDHLTELQRHKHYRSTPDLSRHNHPVEANGPATKHANRLFNLRPCAACNTKCQPQSPGRQRSEYKMAFKAGKPATSLSTSSSFDNPPNQNGIQGPHAKEIRVPKQRAPFAAKNYCITSLAQPFSLWPKETGHAYPEHWRLASVYQHSFKPVQARSKPLLKTVYQ